MYFPWGFPNVEITGGTHRNITQELERPRRGISRPIYELGHLTYALKQKLTILLPGSYKIHFGACYFPCLGWLGSARLCSFGLGSARRSSARPGSARLVSAWARLGSGLARLGLGSAWLGPSARLCSAQLGSAWLSSAWLGSTWLGRARLCLPKWWFCVDDRAVSQKT